MPRLHLSFSRDSTTKARHVELPPDPALGCTEVRCTPPAVPDSVPVHSAAPSPAWTTHTRLRFAFSVGAQAAFVCLLYAASTILADVSGLPLPGNLVGLLLLLLLLETGIVRCSTALTEVASFALRHLGFLFVPFIVGIMAWPSLLAAAGFVLAISLIGGALIGIAVAGVTAQYVARRSV